MLRSALEYREQLNNEYQRIKYDEKYKFLFVHKITELFDLRSELDENCIEYVSANVKNNNEIMGYFLAEVDINSNVVTDLRILNFKDKGNITFARDLYEFLESLFIVEGHNKLGFSKLEFKCVCGNPIERMYIRYVEKYRGSVVGTFHNSLRLSDGKIYDYKMFEVFKEDFDRINKDKNNKIKREIIL